MIKLGANNSVLCVSLAVVVLSGCTDSSSQTDNAELESPSQPIATAPTVSTTTPTADAVQIALDANVEVTFSQDIAQSSVDNTQFTLHTGNTAVPATVTFDGTTAVLDPNSDLLPSTEYHASLADGIVDTDGTALVPYEWSFYSVTAPTVSTTTPTADAIQIALDANLEATFSQNMAISSVDNTQFTLHNGNTAVPATITFDGTTAILDPDSDLLSSTQYRASLTDAIVDTYGTALVPHEWSFYSAGNGWTPEVLIEDENTYSTYSPQISSDATGNAIAVWLQSDGTRENLYANRFDVSTATWGTAELIENNNAGTVFYPQVSTDATGNTIVVWQQSDGTRKNTYANRFDASTGNWGVAELIESDNSGDTAGPQVSVDSEGNAVAVWSQDDGATNSIYVNRFDVSTATWGSAEKIETDETNAAISPAISIGANGDALVVWRHSDGTRDNIHANRFDASTQTWGSAQLIESNNFASAFNPQISVDGEGNAVAVWNQSNGTTPSIYSNRFDASTQTWGNAQLIETDDVGNAYNARISTDADGNAIAVWQQFDGTRYNILANRYDASTDTWGSAELIENDNAGAANDPRVSVDSEGNAITVWYQNDGTRTNIYANRFDVSTATWGGAQLIESGDAGNAARPQISTDSSGNAIAVWYQGDGTRSNIHAARFDLQAITP